MYRVSREGRRASSNNHGADTPPRGSYKDRFAHSASSAYDKKSFSTPASNRPLFRNPKVQVYLKIAAVVASLFFLRGLHRSMCADNLHVQLDSNIAGTRQELDTIVRLRKSLEEEMAARRKAEDTVADLVSKDRAHAGLQGQGFNAPMISADIENENSHGDMLSDEQPAGDLTDLLEEAKADFRETQLEVQALESKNQKLEQQLQSLQAEAESRRGLVFEKAEGGSERDGGGGGGGRGDSNEASGDSFRVGGGEARGNAGIMKHRFGKQTASGEGSDRAKTGVYRADDESDKAKSGGIPLEKASPDGKLPSPNQWIIGVGSGGQSGEAGEHEEDRGDDGEEEAEGEGGGGGHGTPADRDSHDPFANVKWGPPGVPDGGDSQDPASPSANGEDGMTFDVHVDSGLPGQASGEREETLAEKYGRAGEREDTPNDNGIEDGRRKPFEKKQLGKATEGVGSNGSGKGHEGKGAKGSVAGDTGDWDVEEDVDWAKVKRDMAIANKNSVDADGTKRKRKEFLRRPTRGGSPGGLTPRSDPTPSPQGRDEAGGGGGLKGNDEMSMGDPVEFEGGAEDSGEEDFFGGLRRGGEEKEEGGDDGEEEESDKQSGDDEERGGSEEDDDEEQENSKEEDDDFKGGGRRGGGRRWRLCHGRNAGLAGKTNFRVGGS